MIRPVAILVLFAAIARATTALVMAADEARPHGPQHAVRTIPNVTYAVVDGIALRLDIDLPQTDGGRRPAVLYLHGGAWKFGSRADPEAVRFADALARRGYVVAKADYRLSGEAAWPAALHDCKAAVRWLKANADRYGIDPHRIAAMGYSAGAHLAALLGTTAGIPAADGSTGPRTPDASVSAVIAIAGVYDTAVHYRDRHSDAVAGLLGGRPGQVPERYRLSSPIRFVARAVPHLLIHGMSDQTAAFAQARAYEHALRAADVPVETLYVVRAGHGLPRDTAYLDRIVGRADAFLGAVDSLSVQR